MKKQMILGAATLLALGLSAAPISPEEALSRIDKGMAKKAGLKEMSGARLTYTEKTAAGNPAVYVFNNAGGGYLVLGADDTAYPMLGYTDSGSFDETNMPPQLKWWLGEYARQIAYASEHASQNALASSSKKTVQVQGEAIAPQIKTKWDQVEPYNDMCPLYGSNRTYTGCVATAMAQVMNYWKYPEVGQGQISYDSESLGKRLSLNFANRKFDWANMLDNYLPGQYNQEQAEAVAYLMKAAGYSVKMDYDADSSGALAMNIANGLLKYFKYDPNMLYTLREYYSATEWAQMIYDNLKNVGPLLYGGGTLLGGGHSFICDGYDGNGMFHFNWGWSGMSDGYFSLNALNPTALGSGGGLGGGYNFTQDAVFGIQPPTGKPAENRPLAMTQMGSLAGVINGSVLSLDLYAQEQAMWVNYNPTTLKLQFGTIVEPVDGTRGDKQFALVSNSRFSVQPGYGTNVSGLKPQLDLATLNLADGTYKVTMATKATNEDNAEPVPVKVPYSNYNFVTVTKAGSTYTLKIEDVGNLHLIDGNIIGDLYVGCLAKIKIEVENDNEIELTKGFAPALIINGTLAYLGESIFLTLEPGEKVTREWTTSFTQMAQSTGITQDTEFYLTFFDESTYNFFSDQLYKKVVMKPVLTQPQVEISKLPVIKDAEIKRERIGTKDYDVYNVKDRMDIQVESEVTLRNGVFGYQMLACVVPFNTTGTGNVAVLAYGGMPMILDVNEPMDFKAQIGFADMQFDKYYQLVMAYDTGSALMPVPTTALVLFKLAEMSGIEETGNDLTETGNTTIYNLQGVYVGEDLDALPAGIYIVNGKKVRK